MTLLLAQAASNDNPFGNPTSAQILLWLACAFAVLKMIQAGSDVLSKFTGKPIGSKDNPNNVALQHDAPTRREMDALAARMQRQEEEMREMERRLSAQLERIGHSITAEIKSVADHGYKGRSALWQEVNSHKAQIGALDERTRLFMDRKGPSIAKKPDASQE